MELTNFGFPPGDVVRLVGDDRLCDCSDAAGFVSVATWKRKAKERRLFPEFYAVAFCLTSLLPENLRPDENAGWIGLLVARLTLVSAIFIFCWLGTLRPRKWHFFALAACAAVYFTFVYRDTRLSNQLEENAERITRTLPPGTRVLATIFEPPAIACWRCMLSIARALAIVRLFEL